MELKKAMGEEGKKKTVSHRRPSAVRARLHKEGAMALIQRRLEACFDTVPDAFAYMDIDGNNCITKAEFATGVIPSMRSCAQETAREGWGW